MEKTTTIPADFLDKLKLLPDGTATADQQIWLKSWAGVAQKQVSSGKLRLWEIDEFDAETGQVPNSYIEKVYLQNRRLH